MKPIGNEIVGRQYGKLTVLSFDRLPNGRRAVICRCSCGNEKPYDLGAVRTGNSTCCGCIKKPTVTDDQVAGLVFGRLTVIRRNGTHRLGAAMVDCRCVCGTVKHLRLIDLRCGSVASCGCLRDELRKTRNLTHGQSREENKTKEYRAWTALRNRCSNPRTPGYKDYGGRGITVCERWSSFENFISDMGKSPPGTSIDRIKNDKGYSPENCRWATKREQEANKRSNILIQLNGISKPIFTWAQEFGINGHTAWARWRRGWPRERLFIPQTHLKKCKPQ